MSGDSYDATEARGALEGLAEGFRSDGYELVVQARGQQIQIRIAAGPNACEDCLVPKQLMTELIVAQLRQRWPEACGEDIQLVYPTDSDVG